MPRRTRERTDIAILGATAHPLRDAYHFLLRMRWPGALGIIATAYLLLNFVFALAYWVCGGIAGATDGSLESSFYFSVQTMGTIGYGAIYPASRLAHVLVIAESVASLIVTALATGIVFARFSQPSSVMVFSERVAIGPMNGVPTLAFRVGNDRKSGLVEAEIRVILTRTEITAEGSTFYRMYDLALTRSRSPLLTRSWTVLHPITETSPLFGATPASCEKEEVEIVVSVMGTDEWSSQPVHGRTQYDAKDVAWGARLADILEVLPDGRMQLDVRRFDEIVPTQPTESFPYTLQV